MTALAPVVYLVVVTWAILQSNRRWMTLLWIVVSLAATVGAFALAGAIWPDLAGVLGHAAAIPSLLISALVGVKHMRSHRRPSVPKVSHPVISTEKLMHTTSARPAICLECGNPLHVAEMFAVEVTSGEGLLKGYLHIQDCRTKWETKNPNFYYGPPSPPTLNLKYVPETWLSEGYIEGHCPCGHTVRITSTEISDERHARQMLDHKMFEHEAEKHSG
jgi:hypothetical protein